MPATDPAASTPPVTTKRRPKKDAPVAASTPAIDGAPVVAALTPPTVAETALEVGETVYLTAGSDPLTVDGYLPSTEVDAPAWVRVSAPDGATGEYPVIDLTRTPTSASEDGAAPVANGATDAAPIGSDGSAPNPSDAPADTVIDPNADPFADEPLPWAGLADAVLGSISGLMHNARELAAFRLYREQIHALGQPEPSLGAAKLACEALAATVATPEGFALPEQAPPPDEETRRLLAQAAEEADAEQARRQAAAPKRKPPPPRVTGQHTLMWKTRDIAVPVDDATRLVYGDKLASLESDLAAEKVHAAKVKLDLKNRANAITGEQARLASIIRDRQEIVSVRVRLVADFDTGVVREIVEATGQVVEERPIADQERQMRLFPVDAPAPGEVLPDGPTPSVAPVRAEDGHDPDEAGDASGSHAGDGIDEDEDNDE